MSSTSVISASLLIIFVAACESPPTLETPATAAVPPGETWAAAMNAAMGTALSSFPGGVVVGVPTHGSWEDTTIPGVSVYAPPYGEGVATGYIQHDWQTLPPNASPPRLGWRLLTPGDLNGDGHPDVVLFGIQSDVATTGASGWLVFGDVLGPIFIDDPDVIPLGEALGGTPCGDVTGDGAIDLCLFNGIVAGPVLGEAPLHTTWATATPANDVRMVTTDLDANDVGELFVWDPPASAVHYVDTFPEGEHDLEAMAVGSWVAPAGTTVTAMAAGGDLTGDGHPDVAVAWTDGTQSRIAILTDAAGGDLTATEVTVHLPALSLGIGDLNGDGEADLAVGYAHRDTPDEVRVFFGPLAAVTNATDADRWWVGEQGTRTGSNENTDDRFGTALAVGDADGDGQDDVVIGAPQDGDDLGGRVYVVPGPI